MHLVNSGAWFSRRPGELPIGASRPPQPSDLWRRLAQEGVAKASARTPHERKAMRAEKKNRRQRPARAGEKGNHARGKGEGFRGTGKSRVRAENRARTAYTPARRAPAARIDRGTRREGEEWRGHALAAPIDKGGKRGEGEERRVAGLCARTWNLAAARIHGLLLRPSTARLHGLQLRPSAD